MTNCKHQWKKYYGFTEAYYFCEICIEKRDELPPEPEVEQDLQLSFAGLDGWYATSDLAIKLPIGINKDLNEKT